MLQNGVGPVLVLDLCKPCLQVERRRFRGARQLEQPRSRPQQAEARSARSTPEAVDELRARIVGLALKPAKYQDLLRQLRVTRPTLDAQLRRLVAQKRLRRSGRATYQAVPTK